MAETLKQYAFYNMPIAPDAIVPPEDAWLFNTPLKTYSPGHPEAEIFQTYQAAARRGPRIVGMSKIPSRVILKVRHVHFTNYLKVAGSDAFKGAVLS